MGNMRYAVGRPWETAEQGGFEQVNGNMAQSGGDTDADWPVANAGEEHIAKEWRSGSVTGSPIISACAQRVNFAPTPCT